MVNGVQVIGIFSGQVEKSLFQNIDGSKSVVSGLYKMSAIDLTSDSFEEIKKTGVENGVKYSFQNLTDVKDKKKRACAFYSDQESAFIFDFEGTRGCVLTTPNKTVDGVQVPDQTQAICTCNHNTIFGLSEFTARNTTRKDMDDAFRLTFNILIALLIVFFSTF